MTNADEQMKFPIQGADKCPVCGSEETIGRRYFDELEDSGKVPKGSLKEGMTLQIPLLQTLMGAIVPTNPSISVLNVAFEICGNTKCFSLYVTKVFITQQPVQIQMKPGLPPGQMSPPFLRG